MNKSSWWERANPHSFECNQFAAAISNEANDTFITLVAVKGYKTDYFIRGKPYFVNDGDDRRDDMTGSMPISHCPFCGLAI